MVENLSQERRDRLEYLRQQRNVAVVEPLIFLERQTDQCLLTSGLFLDPLHIPRGASYVKEFIERVGKGISREQLIQMDPGYEELFNLTAAYGILVTPTTNKCHFCNSSCAQPGTIQRDGCSIYLLLTQYCNLGCIYCLNGDDTYQKQKHLKMTREIAFAALENTLATVRPGGKIEIVFFGGEPLLNWKLAKEIILFSENELKSRFPDRLIHYHLTSNLSILPDDLIEWAKKYGMTFLCDIDGPHDVHNRIRPALNSDFDSFNASSNNIRRLIDSGLSVALRTTVTSFNVDSMMEIASTHSRLGGSSTAFVTLTPINSDERALPYEWYPDPQKFVKGLTGILKSGLFPRSAIFPINQIMNNLMNRNGGNLGCGAPWGNTPVVDVNGNVYPCIYWVGNPKLKMNTVWENTPDHKVLQFIKEFASVDAVRECENCEYRYFCRGGCAASRLINETAVNPDPEIRTYINEFACNLYKTFIPEILWFLIDNPDAVREKRVKCEG